MAASRRRSAPVLALATLAVTAGAIAEEEARRELPGPAGGFATARLVLDEATVLLRVAGDGEPAGPAASLSWRAGMLDLASGALAPEAADGAPLLVADVKDTAFSLVRTGPAPDPQTGLVVELLVGPAAQIEIEGRTLTIEAGGRWAFPEQAVVQDPAPPPRRRLVENEAPLFPPAEASLSLSGERLSVEIEGWPGSLTVRSERAEVVGQDVGGRVEVFPGRGAVRLRRVGGTLRASRERSPITVEQVQGHVDASASDGDVFLTDCRGGVMVKVTGGQAVLREIGQRADVHVEDGSFEVEGLQGHLGGAMLWSEVSLVRLTGGVQLKIEEGRLVAREIFGRMNLQTTNTEIDLAEINGHLRIEASLAPVKLARILQGLDLRAEQAEVVLEDVRQVLKVHQDRGTLVAREVTAAPDLTLTDVQLDYRHGGRLGAGGTLDLHGGRATIRVPRQTRLLLGGDEDRVQTTLPVAPRPEEEGGSSRPASGQLQLTVEGGDVEVIAFP